MTIAIASGKGGAGKTSIAAALVALLGHGCVMADCDVDAANGAIALGAKTRETVPYYAGPGFEIDFELCTGCGLCAAACRFSAIAIDAANRRFAIIPELCERCGACLDRCPAQAIRSFEKQAGRLFVSDTRLGVSLVHAELVPGEDSSGKLVRKVRERAEAIAGITSVIVVDSPPGIGCPVIASLSGSDLVLVVVEASASGIRDAERLIRLVASMNRRSVALINKTGLNASMDTRAKSLLANAGIPLAGEIAFDPILRSIEEQGRTWIDVESEVGDSVRRALGGIQGIIAGLSRRNEDHDSRKELT